MSREWLLTASGADILVLTVSAFLLLRLQIRQNRLAARIQMSRGVALEATLGQRERGARRVIRMLRSMGRLILRAGLLSAKTRTELEMTLRTTGLRGSNGLEIFIGGKIGLLIALPLLATLVIRQMSLPPLVSWLVPAAAAVLGLLLPDMIVRYRRRRYVQGVERGLPDALDLLVICAQAGLGLTASITKVSEEMLAGHQGIGLELAITANELQMLANTRTALANIGTRTGIEGLIRLGTTLIQSMQYGTPLSEAMRALSAEMRQDTLTRFEARAARLGVMLTLPMVVFILPCVFLIVGGPAVVQVMRLWH